MSEKARNVKAPVASSAAIVVAGSSALVAVRRVIGSRVAWVPLGSECRCKGRSPSMYSADTSARHVASSPAFALQGPWAGPHHGLMSQGTAAVLKGILASSMASPPVRGQQQYASQPFTYIQRA
jgi:hypothetical protein